MLMRSEHILPAGTWDASREVDRVLIDHDRRCIRLQTEAGNEVMLDLPQSVALRHGDGLALTDGSIVRVVAATAPSSSPISAPTRRVPEIVAFIERRDGLS
jgi:urease accessory protein